jgi:hypothetical protein
MKTSGIRQLAVALLAVTVLALPAAAGQRIVVELFTSQGCSACPPADVLLGKLAERDDLLALSLPIDYWDFLGWKDTLADPAFSERQRAYARKRGDSKVYTPQMVIGGINHAVGSNVEQVEDRIEEARAALAKRQLTIGVVESGDTITVNVDGQDTQDVPKATVWLVFYRAAVPVKIGRGENSGRTVIYHNVVREMTPIGMWHGTKASFDLPRSELIRGTNDGCAVLVQAKDTGPMLGAAVLGVW